jgi:hypothetical protein
MWMISLWLTHVCQFYTCKLSDWSGCFSGNQVAMWWEPDSHVALSLNRVLTLTILQFMNSFPNLVGASHVFNFRLTGSFQFYFQTYSLVAFHHLLPGRSLYMSNTFGALPVPAAPVQTHPLECLSFDFDYECVRCQLINPFLAQL